MTTSHEPLPSKAKGNGATRFVSLLVCAGIGALVFGLVGLICDLDKARKEFSLQEEREMIARRGELPSLKERLTKERVLQQVRIDAAQAEVAEFEKRIRTMEEENRKVIEAMTRKAEDLAEQRNRLKDSDPGYMENWDKLNKQVGEIYEKIKGQKDRGFDERQALTGTEGTELYKRLHQEEESLKRLTYSNIAAEREKEALREIIELNVRFPAAMAVRLLAEIKWAIGLSAGFLGLWGVICWGAGVLAGPSPDPVAGRGLAIIGGIVGLAIGAAAGTIGGYLGRWVPEVLGLAIYGAIFGAAAYVIVLTVPARRATT